MSRQIDGKDIPEFVPDWYFKEVCNLATKEFHRFNNASDLRFLTGITELGIKLACSDSIDMKRAWASIDKRYSIQLAKDTHDPYSAIKQFRSVFVMPICSSALPLNKNHLLSVKQREKVLADIQLTTDHLIDLVKSYGLDYQIDMWFKRKGYYHSWADIEGLDPGLLRCFFLLTSELLGEIRNMAEHHYAPERTVLRKPGSDEARKLYYCRRVSKFFQDYLDTPLYEATASIAACLLDEAVDAEYVRFAVKGLNVKKSGP